MPVGMKIYLAVCALLGLSAALVALMYLVGGGCKGRLKWILADMVGLASGLFVFLVALLALWGVVK